MRPLSETIARAGEWGRHRVWQAQAVRACASVALRSSRTRGASPRWLLGRLAYLRREGYFVHPELIAHAATMQLLDPTAPAERLDEIVSPIRLREVQLRLSPPPLSTVIDDKALFYTVCRLARLPIPDVYAFVYRDAPGWTRDGRTPRTRDEWASALERLRFDDVVAKPAEGDMGEGVRAFRREGDRFFEGSDVVGDAGALYDTLLGDGRFGGFVLQRRVYNHEALAGLGGTSTLQATRLVTLVDGGSDVNVLVATQKIVRGDAVTDNVHNGESGNGSAAVDIETGRLGPLVLPIPGKGLLERDDHPETGRTCRGLQLPWWPETLELVRRASVAFGMLRTIGWDVAITSTGPLLLEANSGWGPLNGVAPMAPVLRRLEAAVRAEEELAQTLDAELEQLARAAATAEPGRNDAAAR